MRKKEFTESMYTTNKRNIIVTDNEKIVAASGDFGEDLTGKKITKDLEERLKNRNTQIYNSGITLNVCDNYTITNASVVKPINVFGDVLGCVIVEGKPQVTDSEKSLAEFGGLFMSRYLEI